jgi:lipopolysaccharide/colanic/teichoic acid biosynthesis glycosyltransferase
MTIVTSFTPDKAYQETVRRTGANVQTFAPAEHLGRALGSLEPSDWVLLIDPRCWPVRGMDLRAFLSQRPDARSARHLTSLEASEQGTKEYIQTDPAGQVRRIQRYYEGVTWLQASAVFCTMASVACLRLLEQSGLDSLLEVRRALAARGVPSQDVLLEGGTMDLHDPRQLLRLAEQEMVSLGRHQAPAGYRSLGTDVWVSKSSHVDETAQLHGPVVVQGNVTIEAGARVVGPALLGAGSRVGAKATVAQCLLMPGAAVPTGATVHQEVVVEESDRDETGTAAGHANEAPGPAAELGRVAEASLAESTQRLYLLVKEGMDRVFALLGLIVLSPLLMVVAGLIRMDSQGPILFGHEREGKGGRVFRCWKFRTMVSGAHAQQRTLYAKSAVDGPQFKIDRDPRITRVGHVLRKTNIDELPQLFNVLAGQMSLIGPRPSPFRENQICIPWRQARLSVRPGITGLWQICRNNRALGDFHQWIYYDMLYVRHMSPALDLKILAATLITFGGRWGMPVTWLIPARRLYRQTRPWMVPMTASQQETETAVASDQGM